MSILVLNAGSSSLKFGLFDDTAADERAAGMVEWRGGSTTAAVTFRAAGSADEHGEAAAADVSDAVDWVLQSLAAHGLHDPIHATGHRLVHGGTEFRRSLVIDEPVRRSLGRIATLAPLHNPPALKVLEAARLALPDAAQVAVFDTAFFAELPARAFIYPLPYEWYERYGIRRFGFHGISHAHCSARAAEWLGRSGDASLRLVICHLGNGCSATAVHGGTPVATTMGFTPLEGLMMGARSGSVDPGILVHLLKQQDFDAPGLEEALNRRSGLLGVSGVSSDFREVERAAESGNQRARLAIDMFADRVRATIGALTVTLGSIDALVFTAGIGEHSAALRSQVCDGLECVGLRLDAAKNRSDRADCDVAAAGSAGRILVVRTREEHMIAREIAANTLAKVRST